MDRKAAELSEVLRPDAWAVATAMAELELRGDDTSTLSIERFLGDAVSKEVAPLMAHVKRNVDWIDERSPRTPRMIAYTTERGGVRHHFAKEACEAILRLRNSAANSLARGSTYSWSELAHRFGFAVGYLNRAGGLPTLPAHNAVMAITHPGAGNRLTTGTTGMAAISSTQEVVNRGTRSSRAPTSTLPTTDGGFSFSRESGRAN
jgi:hypothetical protein